MKKLTTEETEKTVGSPESSVVKNLALIGCGQHAEIGHAIPLARYKAAHPREIELVAACDVNLDRAKSFCAKYSFRAAYSDVDAMLAQERLDGCIMVVPPEKIPALAIKLLSTGIPCVVEKPLGSSLSEVRALRDAAAGKRNMVSVNRRFMPFLNRALEWTRGVGQIRHVRASMLRHNRTEPEFIWATAVHAVDTLRYLCGEVQSHAIRRLNGGAGTAWYSMEFSFKNQSTGRIDVLPTAGVVEETYELFGDGFRATVTSPFGPQPGWRAFRDGKLAAEETATSDMPEDVLHGFYDEASAFIHSVRSGAELNPTIADVAPSIEICFALAALLG